VLKSRILKLAVAAATLTSALSLTTVTAGSASAATTTIMSAVVAQSKGANPAFALPPN
jgi:hypothetical protein